MRAEQLYIVVAMPEIRVSLEVGSLYCCPFPCGISDTDQFFLVVLISVKRLLLET